MCLSYLYRFVSDGENQETFSFVVPFKGIIKHNHFVQYTTTTTTTLIAIYDFNTLPIIFHCLCVCVCSGCGSKTACSSCSSIENVLIIQHDEEVQSAFDIARKVSCNRIGSDEAKMVYFKPFVVDMLDVITIPTDNGSVNCWMDIQRGVYPKLSPIGNSIKIGEELTVMVYLQDKKNEFDLSVRNCWAYDSTDFDDDKTGKVQLSDASGCSM